MNRNSVDPAGFNGPPEESAASNSFIHSMSPRWMNGIVPDRDEPPWPEVVDDYPSSAWDGIDEPAGEAA